MGRSSGKRATKAGAPALPDGDDAERLAARATAQFGQRSAELAGLNEILGSRKRLMWINFVAGLARGVGFFLGVSLVGGIVLGGAALLFDHMASTLGFEDVSMRNVVRAAYFKFAEIQELLEEAHDEAAIKRGQLPGTAPRTPAAVPPAVDPDWRPPRLR